MGSAQRVPVELPSVAEATHSPVVFSALADDRVGAAHAEHGVGYVAAPVFGPVPVAERRYQPPGFTTVLGRKDLHLALDAANDHDIPLPIGELLRTVFDQAIADGCGADDWAVIAEQQPR